MDIVALLALIAALISGIGDVVRQRSAQDITDEAVGHVELLRMSLRDTRWWLGGTAAVASAALQAVALGLGSVVLVQALQVTALLFALPVYAWLTKHRLTGRQWGWAVLLAIAVAVFVSAAEPAAGYQRAPLQTWTVVAAVIGPAMVFCVLGARIWSGGIAAVLLALVSASSWALFAVLTKAIVDVLRRRDVGAAAHTRALWVGAGRRARHDISAVVISGQLTDRIVTDDDGWRAVGGVAAGRHSVRRDAQRRRPPACRLGRGGGSRSRRDNCIGSRRSGNHGGHRRSRSCVSGGGRPATCDTIGS